MSTLKSTLETEFRSEVIFGHVHRRQKEIDEVLDQISFHAKDRCYDRLTPLDILDLTMIREFFDTLTGQWQYETAEKAELASAANVALRRAATGEGITKAELNEHHLFGVSLAFRAIGTIGRSGYDLDGLNRYSEILNPATAEVPAIAA